MIRMIPFEQVFYLESFQDMTLITYFSDEGLQNHGIDNPFAEIVGDCASAYVSNDRGFLINFGRVDQYKGFKYAKKGFSVDMAFEVTQDQVLRKQVLQNTELAEFPFHPSSGQLNKSGSAVAFSLTPMDHPITPPTRLLLTIPLGIEVLNDLETNQATNPISGIRLIGGSGRIVQAKPRPA